MWTTWNPGFKYIRFFLKLNNFKLKGCISVAASKAGVVTQMPRLSCHPCFIPPPVVVPFE